MDNTITVSGNLTRDPEPKIFASGARCTNFSIAVNDSKRNKETQGYDSVLDGFFNCTAWDKLGENVANSLRKGDRVTVTGRMLIEMPKDTEDKRVFPKIKVHDVGASLKWNAVNIPRGGASMSAPVATGYQPAPPMDYDEPAPTNQVIGADGNVVF